MRRLMILPIVHSRSDLGSLQSAVNDTKVAALGINSAASISQGINEFWDAVRVAITQMELDHSQVVIYQDGLPVVANVALEIEKRIVDDLARAGSPNHLLVQWLMQHGAVLVGTESPELLVQEYNAVRRNLAEGFRSGRHMPPASNDSTATTAGHAESRSLLAQRDRFIAQRIDSTLGTIR